MANSATVGVLRVLLTGNSAELEAAYKRSTSATKSFLNELKAVQKDAQDAGRAVSQALGKALDDSEKGLRGFLTTARQFSGIDLVGQANAYAKAIDAIGGTSRLTREEQDRVNAVLQQALAKYQALGREAPEALQKLEAQTRRVQEPTTLFGRTLGDLNNQIKATALGFISAQAIIGTVSTAWHTLTQFVADSVKAYLDAEAAQKKLTAALTSAGTATPQVIGQYKNLAEQFQRTTVFEDDLITEMEALLTQVGGVMPGEMNKALTAATDLAAGLGIDLRTATMLVGKAFEGETGTLKRYGIVIDEAKLKTQGADAVLGAIQAKFGGQAQAELDTYAGKVKQLANNWNDLQEFVGEIAVTNPIVEAALRLIQERIQGTDKTVKDHAHSWSDLLRRLNIFGENAPNIVAAFVRQVEDAADAANKLAKVKLFEETSNKPMPAHETPEQRAEREAAAIRKKAQADKEAAAALQKHAEAIRALRNEISGRNLQQQVRDLTEALNAERKAGLLTADSLNRFAEAADKLRRNGATLTPELFKLVIAHGDLSESIGEVKRGLESADKAWEVTTDDMKETLAIIEKMIPKLDVNDGLPSGFALVGATAKVSNQELKEMGILVEKQLPAIDRTIKALRDVGNTFGMLASVAHGSTAQILADLQSIAFAAEDVVTGIEKFSKGDTFGGIASVTQGIVGIWDHFFGSRGRDMVVQFAQSLGGFDALHQQLAQLGTEGEMLWTRLTQGVGRNNPQQAQAAIDAVNAALARLQKTNQQFNADLQTTLSRIRDLGGTLPDALKPYLDQLAKAGRLTQDNLDLLAQISGTGGPSWQTVQAAVERYGGSVEKIGGTFQAARLHDSWQQVIDDVKLFTDAGISTADQYDLVKGKIIALVQDSQRFGTEIPENMRPWIEKLAASGELLDENGNKIEDISKLKFGATLQTTLEKLNTTLELILKNILGIKPALDGVPREVNVDVNFNAGEFPSYPAGVPTGRENARTGNETENSFASGTSGLDYESFGAGSLAMLHGREAVIPERGAGALAAQIATALGGWNRMMTSPVMPALAAGAGEKAFGVGPFVFQVPPGELYRAMRDGTPIVVDAINGNHLGARTQSQKRGTPLGAI